EELARRGLPVRGRPGDRLLSDHRREPAPQGLEVQLVEQPVELAYLDRRPVKLPPVAVERKVGPDGDELPAQVGALLVLAQLFAQGRALDLIQRLKKRVD